MFEKFKKLISDKKLKNRLDEIAVSIMKRGRPLEEGLEYFKFLEGYRPYQDLGMVYEPDAPFTMSYASVLGLLLLGVAELNPYKMDDVEGVVKVARSCYMGGMCTLSRAAVEEAGYSVDGFESVLKIYEQVESLYLVEPEKMSDIGNVLGLAERYKKASDAWEGYLADRSIATNLLLSALKDA